MHSQVSDIQRMTGRNCSPPHDRCYHRYICLIYNFRKYLVCPGNIYTASCKEKRLLRFFEHFEGTLQLPHMHACIRLVSADVYSVRIVCASEFAHYVFRKVDEHRSRAPCPRNIKRFFNNTSEILTVSHSHSVFCNAARDTYDIHFLKCVISDQVSCHLSRKTDKRDTVIVCCCKSCHEICRARSARHQTHSHFPCRPCICISLMYKRLLMAWKDDSNVILFVQLIADIYGARSRIAEDRVHSFLF